MKFFVVLLLSCISSCLYRMGGSARYNTKYRDILCSLISVLAIGYLVAWHWTLFLVFGLTWASLTTYWKAGPKAYWFNWIFTGVGYSVAVLPFCIAEGHWLGFVSRTFILGISTMIWSELNSNAVWEEMGRGALLILTVPILLIYS